MRMREKIKSWYNAKHVIRIAGYINYKKTVRPFRNDQPSDQYLNHRNCYRNSKVRELAFGHVRPAKIKISLHIGVVWSESSLAAFWIAKDAKFPHADIKDSDQMCILI